MRGMSVVVFACLLGLIAVTPAQEEGEAAAAPDDPASDASAEEAPEAEVPLVIPDAEKKRRNPVADSPEVIARGKTLYNSQCTMCHGSLGDGRGDLVERLGLTVPDFTSAEEQQRRTDGELFFVLSQGHGSMPGQEGRLEDEERWAMIRYIRTLRR
jgi:mono/diheme cytochrome c family protein